MTLPQRTFLVPEVMQSSLMDCGPAALKAVLEGFGTEVHYDVLRARCETDVDGTSISALARLGGELGLRSHEVLVSRDSFLLPQARCLPAIVVTRSGAGQLHFIVVWRIVAGWVQVMDPASGRRWLRRERFLETLPELPIPISQERFRRWVGSATAIDPLRARIRALGVGARRADTWLARTQADPTHRAFAALDAAVRMVRVLVDGAALSRGSEAARVLESVLAAARTEPEGAIPKYFWWAMEDPKLPGKLLLRGSVIVHFEARPAEDASAGADPVPQASCAVPANAHAAPAPAVAALPAPALRALSAPRMQPSRVLFHVSWADASRTMCWIALALFASAALIPVESIVLRSLLTVQGYLALDYQRATGAAVVIALMVVSLWLELWAFGAIERVGRQLEGRIRAALLEKLPLLDDTYLRTRPSSDVAGRGHALHLVRGLPAYWAQSLRAGLVVGATAFGLLWLFPAGGYVVALAVVLALVIPTGARRSLAETSVRLRSHASALDVFYLDALIGVTPVRVHGAELAVRRQHEALLVEWGRTAGALRARATSVQAVQLLASTAMAIWLVTAYVHAGGEIVGLLLLSYWALRMQGAAQELAFAQLGLRNLRSVTLRLLAPLAAPARPCAPAPQSSALALPRGAHIQFEHVSVHAGGHVLLRDIQLDVPAGSHVAIVGASGAGKSTLLSVLLGFAEVSSGRLRVDGQDCDPSRLARLRREIAWIDPAVRIWDRSLYDNLLYSDDRAAPTSLPETLAAADLYEVLEQLPDGMQTQLGEGGGRVSGGQGQRVRIGRALMQSGARLVLLDEPFRGLPHADRTRLLDRVRDCFRDATLLFVSHDVCDTLGFDRVLVIERGQIVEDAAPDVLRQCATSRYARLIESESAQRTQLWAAERWDRQTIEHGRLMESASK